MTERDPAIPRVEPARSRGAAMTERDPAIPRAEPVRPRGAAMTERGPVIPLVEPARSRGATMTERDGAIPRAEPAPSPCAAMTERTPATPRTSPARPRGPAMTRPGAGAPGGEAGATFQAGPHPPVSIVIPARDETAMLPAALASVEAQDYPGEIETVVADGSEGPAMAGAVRARFPHVRIVANPDRHIPAGLNRAVRAATHRILVRCDARCVLPPDYVRTAVATLRRTGAPARPASAASSARSGPAPSPGRWRWP